MASLGDVPIGILHQFENNSEGADARGYRFGLRIFKNLRGADACGVRQALQNRPKSEL